MKNASQNNHPTPWRWFLSALFPQKCLVCEKEGALLCPKHKTFAPPPINKVHFQYIDNIEACTAYTDQKVQKIIEHFKYFGNREAGLYIQEAIKNKIKKNDNVIPVPLHWTRKLWRGFNQAEYMVQNIDQKHILKHLKRIKRTHQQAKRSKEERQRNIKNAFIWKSQTPPPPKVILIDDVVASGSTLDECARVLKKAGCKRVDAYVFARGGR